jgi:ADP-ribose pyrophosphatase YjhB (NUDIX family)
MRETVRAVILDSRGRTFLVQHYERNPADFGKWATVGGGLEADDVDHHAALRREIGEEFGLAVLERLRIGEKLREHRSPGRLDHFYLVRFDGVLGERTGAADELLPIALEEIFAHRWFTLAEARGLSCFFGVEVELVAEGLAGIGREGFG